MFHYTNIESIICGEWMPHKIPEIVIAHYDEHYRNLYIGSETSGKSSIIYIVDKYTYFNFIDEIPKDENELADNSFEQKVLKDLSGEIWYPPSKKAYYFALIVLMEKSNIVHQYRTFFHETTNSEHTQFIVDKEIHAVKSLAKDLRIYTLDQIGNLNNFNKEDSNHYVIYLLQDTLIDLLLRIYKMYDGLISINAQNEKELRSELFEEASVCSAKDQDKTWGMVNKLFRTHIEKIFEEFNNDLFTCNDLDDFYNAFRYETVEKSSLKFTAKSKTKFYYLLHEMWDNKEMEIKRKFTSFTKESYFEPILKNCNLSVGSFNLKTRIYEGLEKKDSKFKKTVNKLLI